MSTEAKILESRATEYHASYSEDFKASIVAAIANNDGNVLATSKLFNLPRDTVYYWWKHSDRYFEVKQPSSGSLPQKLENIAHNLAESIAEHDLSIVPLASKASALNVVVDKMQLLKGMPTSISASVMSEEERMDRLSSLVQAIRERAPAIEADVTSDRIPPDGTDNGLTPTK